MFRRIICAALMLSGLAGCRAVRNFHGDIDFAQWTPKLTSSAQRSGGSYFNLVGSGGVVDKEAFVFLDASLRFQTGSGRRAKPHAVNLGYWQYTYSGDGDAGLGLDFAGKTLIGPIRTTADFKLYRVTYEEPGLTQGGDGRTGGTLGIHLLGFDIKADDGSNIARFSGTAPMLVMGWKIAYYSKGLMYYFGVEGMDLDVVSLGNVRGNVVDTIAGVRWFFGDNLALSVGWRNYDADITIRNDRLRVKQEGAVVALYMKW